MIYVVGSGPAGISAAVALLERGKRVTMLDAGTDLEPARQAVVARMQGQPWHDWADEDVAALKEGMTPSSKGVPVKYAYGSDFPYRDGTDSFPLIKHGVDTSPSLARGGLSNVWGASLLPYRAEDMEGWPLAIEDLVEHYRSVFSFMNLSGTWDCLADLFPLYAERPQPLQASEQARALLNEFAQHREALRSAGVRFGQSRLAVRAMPEGDQPGCAYCGLCMYGCPYGLIYSSTSTLPRLQANERFAYIGGVVVETVREVPGGVTIEGRSRVTGEALRWKGDRVCLACGTIMTTRVLLASLEAYDRPVRLADSQYFMFPLLRFRKSGCARQERLHTLSQVFLEILDDTVSRPTVHLQLYTYNEMFLGAMKAMVGPLFPVLKWPVHQMVERMILAQGFLHSDLSPFIEVVLNHPQEGRPGVLQLHGRVREVDTRAIIRRVVEKVRQQSLHLKAMPVGRMLQIAQPGRSFHSGGSFPMRRRPAEFESDLLGRPRGLERVHAVDSTVFPSIPATTITLTVMANAHRIGQEVGAG